MYFTKDGAEKFQEIFHESSDAIRQMNGCSHLALLRDLEDSNHFTTISHWDSSIYLDEYRNSALFKNVWGRVKPLFSSRPLAHSFQSATPENLPPLP